MIPTTKRAHHSGKRFMLVRGIGVLPSSVPELTRDVSSRALRCEPCRLDVLTAEAEPVCPRCQKPLTVPPMPGAKGWARD